MKLQELINENEIDLNLAHIKAFFLGVMSAEKPMPFSKAVEEMLSETPEAVKSLEPELKSYWDLLAKNKPAELQNLFPPALNIRDYLMQAKDQLDFYLTAMSLSGTHTESVKNEDLADLIDELEDTVMELDEYLSDEADEAEGEELKEMLLETWADYLRTSKF